MINKRNEYMKKWRKNNPEKVKLIRRRHYEKNTTQILLNNKSWKKRNKIKVKNYNKSYGKEYRPTHREKENARQITYRLRHPELVRERRRIWGEKNPEKILYNIQKHYSTLGAILGMTGRRYKFSLMVWSKSVKKRDGNKCWVCGTNKKLEANHILPKNRYPELTFNINNGITICQDDHDLYHNIIGWR
jgi:hypothetical protein